MHTHAVFVFIHLSVAFRIFTFFSAFRKSFKYLNIFIYASWKNETKNVDVPFQMKYDESKINGKQIKRNETMCNQARNVK